MSNENWLFIIPLKTIYFEAPKVKANKKGESNK